MSFLTKLATRQNLVRATWVVVVALLVAVGALGIFRVDWSRDLDPGDYIVGAGTIALAVGTLALARYTARQAELTKKSIEAAEKPHVIATPHPAHLDGIQFVMDANTLHLFFRVWNIGRG